MHLLHSRGDVRIVGWTQLDDSHHQVRDSNELLPQIYLPQDGGCDQGETNGGALHLHEASIVSSGPRKFLHSAP